MSNSGGRLVLISTPIGNLGDMSPRSLEALSSADSVACEDTRRTGSLFAHFGIAHDPFIVCNEHTEATAGAEILSRINRGEVVALVSDAGTPAVSDPGQRVVQAVIDGGGTVEAIPGPSAALVGLVVSGLATDRFCFDGFLPRKGAERSDRIDEYVAERRTIALFEAPHRVERTVTDLHAVLGDERELVLARELTKTYEEIWRGSLREAVEFVSKREPRGEYVLILGGAPRKLDTVEALTAALEKEAADGVSRRDAVETVVALTGAKKRQVYDLALNLDFASPEQRAKGSASPGQRAES